jgi:DUF1680 family protein
MEHRLVMLDHFSPAEVRLLPGPIRDRQDRNTQYLLELEADRLLHTFRTQAGLPSIAQPLGGWEAPTCGLRGHFVGHYVSACAQGFAATGDQRLRERSSQIVAGLAACQRAIGSGYVSAFPESDLDVIETRFAGAWASYYVLHKILVGLLDAYRYCDDRTALAVAERLANYILRRIEKLTPEQIEGMSRTDTMPNPTNEFGGISEVLQDLADATGRSEFDSLARVFEREWFTEPLVRREDRLTGLHANTHIPMALALARRYERTGETRLRAAVEYFWERTAIARSYANGGSSGPRPDGTEKSKGGEHWPAPFKLAGTLTPKINESCVTHNMLRLTDALFRWTADRRYAEFYQRAYFNHLLAMQHPGHTGGYLYDHPLGSGSTKKFGEPCDSFWCCYGSSVEAFERLSQGIYYHDAATLWVNLPVASEVTWREKGLRVEQQTDFPHDGRTKLVIHCERPIELTIRTPWAAPMKRTWRDGDEVELPIDLTLHTESMPDDDQMIAFLCGPIVLAARIGEPFVLPAGNSSEALRLLQPVAGQPLTFTTCLASGSEVTLVPLNQIVDESFGVYAQLTTASP